MRSEVLARGAVTTIWRLAWPSMQFIQNCRLKLTPMTCFLRPLVVSLMRWVRRPIPLGACHGPLSDPNLNRILLLQLAGLENPVLLMLRWLRSHHAGHPFLVHCKHIKVLLGNALANFTVTQATELHVTENFTPVEQPWRSAMLAYITWPSADRMACSEMFSLCHWRGYV